MRFFQSGGNSPFLSALSQLYAKTEKKAVHCERSIFVHGFLFHFESHECTLFPVACSMDPDTILKVSSCDVSLFTAKSDDGAYLPDLPRHECPAHESPAHESPPGNHPCSEHEQHTRTLAPGWGESATYLRQPV